MLGSGLARRLALFTQKKCNFILPMDHGLTLGPLPGIHPIKHMKTWCQIAPLDGIIAHKGVIAHLVRAQAIPAGVGVVCHLNGMVGFDVSCDDKVQLTTVKMAVQHGADAVSVQLNFNGHNARENLLLLSRVMEQAGEFGLPVLAMVYVTGSELADLYVQHVRHLLRLCCELAVDMVKIAFPSSVNEVPKILDGFAEDVHVYFAGGQLHSEVHIINMIESAIHSGARGVCMGRNIFQNTQSEALVERIATLC